MPSQAEHANADGSRASDRATRTARTRRWVVAAAEVVVLAGIATGVALSGHHSSAWSDPWTDKTTRFDGITLHYPRGWTAIHPTGPQAIAMDPEITFSMGWLTSAKPYRQCVASAAQKRTIPIEQLNRCSVPVDQLGSADIYLKMNGSLGVRSTTFTPNLRIHGHPALVTTRRAFAPDGAYLANFVCPTGTVTVVTVAIRNPTDTVTPSYSITGCLGPSADMTIFRRILSSATFSR